MALIRIGRRVRWRRSKKRSYILLSRKKATPEAERPSSGYSQEKRPLRGRSGQVQGGNAQEGRRRCRGTPQCRAATINQNAFAESRGANMGSCDPTQQKSALFLMFHYRKHGLSRADCNAALQNNHPFRCGWTRPVADRRIGQP